MGSVSSEEGSDQQSERCGSYSLSADVSESESSGSFTCRRCYHDGAASSSSLASSPPPPNQDNNVVGNSVFLAPSLIFPGILAKDAMLQPQKREADLSGSFLHFFNICIPRHFHMNQCGCISHIFIFFCTLFTREHRRKCCI